MKGRTLFNYIASAIDEFCVTLPCTRQNRIFENINHHSFEKNLAILKIYKI